MKNENNGIHYGAIAARNINTEIFTEIYDSVYYRYIEYAIDKLVEAFEGTDEEREDYKDELMESYDLDEVEGSWELDGIKGELFFLGGAVTLLITDSPHTVNAPLCSPCIPNAGDLDSVDGESGVPAYTVPEDWMVKDE